jgi:hypothetical protein
MGLSKVRRDLYRAAKIMGDAQAIQKTVETGDPIYIEKRAYNRMIARVMSRFFWR